METHGHDLPPELESALDQLSQHGLFTMIWTTDDLVVAGRYGSLAPEINVGSPLCDTAMPLMGLEAEINALRSSPEQRLEIPNVSVIGLASGEMSPRLNYVGLWTEAPERFVLFVSRALAANDISIELQRQVRRRMLIEAELVEQAVAIKAANDTLSRLNKDLADFTRIVSHDLKSPLRALRYFADDLERSLEAPGVDDDPHAHLDRLRSQSTRMSSMLTGLLAYTRLEQKQDAATRIDPRRLVDAIIRSLPVPDRFSIELTGDWPEIDTLEAMLDLVIRNLIDNALKHHDNVHGAITIACVPAEDHLVITVSDDGPGIPLRYQEAVFQPFTQLDADSDTIGMGLTLVRRACEVVGGRVTLDADPEARRGAAFSLIWPRNVLTSVPRT